MLTARFLSFLLLPFILVLLSAPARAADMADELAHRVAFGSAADVEILLGQGIDANTVTSAGTPLTAVAAGRSDGEALPILKKLADAGADLSAGGSAEDFPLIIAVRNNNYEMVKFLAERNVNFNVTDRNGATPKQIAEYYNNQDILGLIADMEAKKQAELEARRAPERFTEFYNKLVFEYCASQYISYYVKSKQDKLSEEESQIILSEQNTKVRDIILVLAQDFNADINQFEAMRQDVQDKIFKELDVMISNRNRKMRGVGKPKDMNERCTRIGKKWLAAGDKAAEGSPSSPSSNMLPDY